MDDPSQVVGIGDVGSTERGSGARFNGGKPQYHLIPMGALEQVVRGFEKGTEKYAPWNWAYGMTWTTPYDCMMRHLEAWHRGEDIDPETGVTHLGLAGCNLIMLLQYATSYTEGDDRAPKGIFEVPSVAAK